MTKRVVLITGCSSGIGEATAARLAKSDWTVYATARKPETLESLAAAGCKTLALDVTSEDSMTAAVDAINRESGAVAALVNNAGYSQSGASETLDLDEVRRQFETNVFGLLRMSQLVLPQMREKRSGRIVNISSMGGRLVFPGGGAYHATKYAVEAFSDAMRFEVAGFGVKVIPIEPGLIATNFDNVAVASMDPAEEGPLWLLQRPGRQVDEGGLHRSDATLRRRTRCGGQGHREVAQRQAAKDPLHGDAVGVDVDRRAKTPGRPRLGRRHGPTVPPTGQQGLAQSSRLRIITAQSSPLALTPAMISFEACSKPPCTTVLAEILRFSMPVVKSCEWDSTTPSV